MAYRLSNELIENECCLLAAYLRWSVCQSFCRWRPGSFKGWLLNTTRWRIQDQFRMRGRAGPVRKNAERDPTKTPSTERLPDPMNLDLDAI